MSSVPTSPVPTLTGEVHPAADVFPLIGGTEFAELVASIREHGLLEPVWVLPDGMLLDGRNRLRACSEAGVEPVLRVYGGDDPVGFVVGLNLHRRHLNESQRAMVAARLATTSRDKGESGRQTGALAHEGAQICTPSQPLATRHDAAELTNVSERSVTAARTVIDEAPELTDAVDAGTVAVSAAADVAKHAPDILPFVASGIVTPKAAVEEARERKKAHVTHNSGQNEWYTPETYLDAARAVMGGIDTDPASSEAAQERVQAATYYTADTNGLDHPWRGRVWMNPPYAQPLIGQFIEKLVADIDNGNVTEAIVLVNNATETAWGQSLLSNTTAACFPRGRIRYLDQSGKPAGAPLQGQMFAYIGPNAELFASVFGEFGAVMSRA